MSGTAVECYAGYRYPERPRAFTWQGEWVKIAAVERQWRVPAGPVFRVCADDDRRFTLTYDETADTWDVQLWHTSA